MIRPIGTRKLVLVTQVHEPSGFLLKKWARLRAMAMKRNDHATFV